MNLRQMRERVASKTDFDPEEPGYRDQVTLLLNEAMMDLWGEEVWPFTQKLVYLDLLPDLTPARLDGQTVTTNDGQRVVTFSAAVDILTARQTWVVGNILTVHGRDYEVLQVNSETELVTTEPIRHPVAGSPPTSPATISGNDQWSIKFRYYTLPEDCLEILNLGHRDTPTADTGAPLDGFKVWSVANRPEESAGLLEDRTADYASMYFPIPPRIVPPAEKLSVTWTENVLVFDGDFVQGTWFEFCWCLMSPDGVHGPLSEPLRVQVPTGTEGAKFWATLNFESFDGQPFAARAPSFTTRGAPEPLEGLRKVVWFNSNFDRATGSRLGEPKWLQVLTGYPSNDPTNENAQVPIVALDTESTAEVRYLPGLTPGNPPYIEWDGQHRRIRPWPRPDSFAQEYSAAARTPGTTWQTRRQDFFRRAELRYDVKPPVLRYDTDTPPMPYQFHRLIVDRALFTIFDKNDDTARARMYEDRYQKGLKKMKARMMKTDTAWRFGQRRGGRPGPRSYDTRITFEG